LYNNGFPIYVYNIPSYSISPHFSPFSNCFNKSYLNYGVSRLTPAAL